MLKRFLADLRKYNYFCWYSAKTDLKAEVANSYLNWVWWILEPLCNMLVYTFVFGWVFGSNQQYYPVFIYSGLLMWNFFSRTVTYSIKCVRMNRDIVTKVYVPKYIYPVTRVLSSGINMLFSLVPLLLVILLTRTALTPAILLLLFALACLLCFCTGMVLVLSASMVFFRDTQFLWNVLSMIWMYATPIFYPESIIPDRFLIVYKFNPLYHFIRFARTVIMDGVSPEPKAYLICLVFAVGSLILGGLIFRKAQDKFVLYI